MQDRPPTESDPHPDITQAREDPRLSRKDEKAVFADFFDAIKEAERSHLLAMRGAEALLAACDRELAVNPSEAAELRLEAVRERRELVAAEIASDFPFQHAALAVSLLFALDALVEHLAPAAREMALDVVVRLAVDAADSQDTLTSEERQLIEQAAREALSEEVGVVPRVAGVTVRRWEEPLEPAGLGADPTRPLPEDMKRTLAELIHSRHVIAHRASRVDRHAHAGIPGVREGELIRITQRDVRRYDAAVRAYVNEIMFRMGIGAPPELEHWQRSHHLWV